jgi:TRAP-type C4-dicarboxylate transport system substrate-binding protein
VARNLNDAAVAERADVEKLNATLKQQLAASGMTINEPDTGPFREALRKAGFYAEWKKKYGDEAWAILEKAVGASLS